MSYSIYKKTGYEYLLECRRLQAVSGTKALRVDQQKAKTVHEFHELPKSPGIIARQRYGQSFLSFDD